MIGRGRGTGSGISSAQTRDPKQPLHTPRLVCMTPLSSIQLTRNMSTRSGSDMTRKTRSRSGRCGWAGRRVGGHHYKRCELAGDVKTQRCATRDVWCQLLLCLCAGRALLLCVTCSNRGASDTATSSRAWRNSVWGGGVDVEADGVVRSRAVRCVHSWKSKTAFG